MEDSNKIKNQVFQYDQEGKADVQLHNDTDNEKSVKIMREFVDGSELEDLTQNESTKKQDDDGENKQDLDF